MKFVVISGTNRPQSQTLRVARYIEGLIKASLKPTESVQLLDLVNLPSDLLKPEAYAEKPKSFDSFKTAMTEARALFFVIPEYNGGAPGVLKYFIDMLPFPESLQRRATGLVGLAAGRFGNLRGVEQMEGVLKYRNAYIYPERTFIPFIDKAIDETGKPKDEMTLKVLSSQVQGFLEFARRLG